jgi:YggT family protein
MQLYSAISNFFQLLQLVLIVRICLTWFPNINWWNQPFKFLREITDPLLEPFRRIVPPIGGLDLSPMVLFFVIGIVEKLVLNFIPAM